MKFSQDVLSNVNRVYRYQDQSVTILPKDDSELITLTSNFILTPHSLVSEWPLSMVSDFTSDDVTYFQVLGIEVLLISHMSSAPVSPAIMATFAKHAIGVEQMTLGAACRTYNLLVSEDREVALAVNF